MLVRARDSLVVGLLLCAGGPGCQAESFFCQDSSECMLDGEVGTCEASGYCSFADGSCASGRRYGGLAPDALADTCVPSDDGTGSSSSGSLGQDDASTGSSSTTGVTTIEPDTTTGSTGIGGDDPSSSEGGASSSTGAPDPLCCDASCSTCGNGCAAEALDVSGDDEGEALAIVATQTHVYWTTGWQTDIRVFDLEAGVGSRLVDLPHTLTKITADEAFIYYLSYGEGFVGRVSLASGAADIVADVNLKTPGHEAGFARLAVDEADVYFALEGPSDGLAGAFRSSKVPGGDVTAIGDFPRPVGIAVDDQAVYISDMEIGLHRAPKDSLTPELLSNVGGGPLVLHDGSVFVGAGGEMLRVSAEGGPATLVAVADGRIEEMVADETHLYATTIAGSVVRAPLDGDGPPTVIASGGSPWGIATNCQQVFWCDNAALSMVGRAK